MMGDEDGDDGLDEIDDDDDDEILETTPVLTLMQHSDVMNHTVMESIVPPFTLLYPLGTNGTDHAFHQHHQQPIIGGGRFQRYPMSSSHANLMTTATSTATSTATGCSRVGTLSLLVTHEPSSSDRHGSSKPPSLGAENTQ